MKIYVMSVYFRQDHWPDSYCYQRTVYAGLSKVDALRAALKEFCRYDEADVYYMHAILAEWENGEPMGERVVARKGYAHHTHRKLGG